MQLALIKHGQEAPKHYWPHQHMHCTLSHANMDKHTHKNVKYYDFSSTYHVSEHGANYNTYIISLNVYHFEGSATIPKLHRKGNWAQNVMK